MMWGWSAFLFLLKLYLPEGCHPNTEILVGKIQTPGHRMLTLIPQSHLHIVFETKIILQLDIYSPGVVCYMLYQ